ncbi:AAA family ATPase [Candidatus Parcubacteria bacterium]|nr:AAA family ATPase [Candidatus Parcubacteria bacterium]MBT7228805.1 AAA family ATPase [Candidatus Parcubacteria bacterium]
MKQALIILNGFSRSGKTTLAKKINKAVPELIKIDSDSILNFLNKNYPVFQDNNSVDGPAYIIRQKSNKAIQKALISTLLAERYSVLLDSNNGRKKVRDKILGIIKKSNKKIKTIIIRHKITEEKLYKNIERFDKKIGGHGWKDLYEKIQKPSFDEPKNNEADYLLIHDKNTEEIILKIKKILK